MAALAEIAPSTNGYDLSSLELAIVIAGSVALYLLVRVSRWLFRLAPISSERRQRWRRVGALLEAVGWLVYLTSATSWVLRGYAFEKFAILFGAAAVVVAALWFFIRDYLTGIVLRAEARVQEGDTIHVGEVEGRVLGLRARTIEVEVGGGDRVLLPYRALRDAPLTVRRAARATTPHTFTITLAPGLTPRGASAKARRAALLSPWSAPARDVRVRAVGEGAIEVTLHALDAERAIEVESAVRAALTE